MPPDSSRPVSRATGRRSPLAGLPPSRKDTAASQRCEPNSSGLCTVHENKVGDVMRGRPRVDFQSPLPAQRVRLEVAAGDFANRAGRRRNQERAAEGSSTRCRGRNRKPVARPLLTPKRPDGPLDSGRPEISLSANCGHKDVPPRFPVSGQNDSLHSPKSSLGSALFQP